MNDPTYDPILEDVEPELRKQIQEDFGRHLVEQRNRMAALVRKWIETEKQFPIPIYDRLIDRIRALDPATRSDIASICLLMADEIVTAVLMAFARGEDTRSGDRVVNYAIIAQSRIPDSGAPIEQVDVNRGEPLVVIWDMYKRWLSRYAPPNLRARAIQTEDKMTDVDESAIHDVSEPSRDV